MKSSQYLILIASCIIMIYCSCLGVKTTTNSKRPVSSAVYNPFIQQIHPDFFVFHASQEKSRLYVKFNLSELLFAPIGQNKSYISKIKIEYKIYPFDDLDRVADTASFIFELKKRKDENSAITYVSLNNNSLDKYYLRVNITDLLKQTKSEEYLLINKQEKGSRQNFMVNAKDINYPHFNAYFSKEQIFSIQHNTSVNHLQVRYYGTAVPLPHPPYSSMVRSDIFYYSDSSWTIEGNSLFEFSGKKEGFYFIQLDSTQKSGIGLLNQGTVFPYIKTSENMVYPLEYLMSTGEFNKIIKSENKKLAIDNFWLDCGRTANRARELIRIYYNRTFYANVYFTSFTEGWRTDRGMIYIMFGPPKMVSKSPGKEVWQYSDRINNKVLQFVFNYNPNPYSDNDYILERNLDFKPFWFEAIKSWRNGKVYNVFE